MRSFLNKTSNYKQLCASILRKIFLLQIFPFSKVKEIKKKKVSVWRTKLRNKIALIKYDELDNCCVIALNFHKSYPNPSMSMQVSYNKHNLYNLPF